MPKLPQSASWSPKITRSSVESQPIPALQEIATQNSQATIKSNNIRTLGVYLITKAKDFAHYIDKLMSTDERT